MFFYQLGEVIETRCYGNMVSLSSVMREREWEVPMASVRKEKPKITPM